MNLRTVLNRLTGRAALLAELTDASRRVLIAEQGRLDAEEARDNLGRELAVVQADAPAAVDAARESLAFMLEPTTDGCAKLRLFNRPAAGRFARFMENVNGSGVGSLEPYRCPICPRQPHDGSSHYWHIRHTERDQRGLHGTQYRRPRGLARVNPAQMARHLERLSLNPGGGA